MALDALSIINDATFTPLGVNSDVLAGLDPNGEEFFIVVATTLRVREHYGSTKHWLTTPPDFHRGGGNP